LLKLIIFCSKFDRFKVVCTNVDQTESQINVNSELNISKMVRKTELKSRYISNEDKVLRK